MLGFVLLIAAGLVGLYFGAEWLVKGAARLANSFGVPALVIGLTLVAFGTSMPEFLVSVTAGLRGSSAIAVGNVVGSNSANIGLILGLTGLFFPVAVHSQLLRRELPLMTLFSLVTWALIWNGELSRFDGLLLFAGILLFTAVLFRVSRRATRREGETIAQVEEFEADQELLAGPGVKRPLELGRALVGIALLMAGAQFLIEGATGLARQLGISDLVIGLTLVSIGTSLPELATSLISALRHEDDISVGNIVGSNIFNLLAVLGGVAIIQPIPVEPTVVRVDYPIMLAFTLLLWPLLLSGQLARWKGGLLLAGYAAYTLFLFAR